MEKEKEVLTDKQIKKMDHLVKIVEKRDRLLKKDKSSDSAVMEEVFDRLTLMTIYDIMNSGVIQDLHGVVKVGKEARVYRGIDGEGNDFAVKIYLVTTRNFKKMMIYIEGDPRFKNIRKDSRSIIHLWARKEFKNLHSAFQSNVRVPKPVVVKNNVLVMEFIGKEGVPAPLLKDLPPENPDSMYKELLNQINSLYVKAKLVHGDLSEYNIMNYDEKPVLFDLSQAVSVEHPMANEFLKRDLNQVNWFFSRLGVIVRPLDQLMEWFLKNE
jgi:RIO kinase 1